MATPRTVAVVVGSLRKDSVSRKLARAVEALTPELKFVEVEIGALPLFDQDLEATPPAEWVTFRDQIRSADAVLFVTPEYNRSVPGVLKNAIDVGSRPYGSSAWNGKPGAVFIIDVIGDVNAIKEAKTIGVPVVAVVDTNADPTLIDYVIPGNDDAIKGIDLLLSYVSQAIIEGQTKATPAEIEKGEDK